MPNGELRWAGKGFHAGKVFFIDDMSADLEPGDELCRKLLNGKDDVYAVDDPALFNNGVFADHHQVKVSRKGSCTHDTGAIASLLWGNQ